MWHCFAARFSSLPSHITSKWVQSTVVFAIHPHPTHPNFLIPYNDVSKCCYDGRLGTLCPSRCCGWTSTRTTCQQCGKNGTARGVLVVVEFSFFYVTLLWLALTFAGVLFYLISFLSHSLGLYSLRFVSYSGGLFIQHRFTR